MAGGKYITHPLAVALLLAELRLGAAIIVAAILHDTLEDTNLSRQDLREQFGEDIAKLVENVSRVDRLDNLRFASKEHAEVENMRRMILAMSEDRRVVLIKLADRLHNMSTLGALSRKKQKRIAQQTLDFYVPISHLAGMFEWRRQLEDYCFKYLHPWRYAIIDKAVKQGVEDSRKLIKKQIKALKSLLKDWGVKADITGREKNRYALYNKMKRRGHDLSRVQDVFAFRVIVETLSECYVALGAVHTHFKPITGEFTDYIAIPKLNGYQSLHTTVFGEFGRTLEIQIRTKEMHLNAETGIASHLSYKEAEDAPVDSSSALNTELLIDLVKMLAEEDDPSETLKRLKASATLFPDEVYVFTPKGDIKRFPKGATVIDFAYSIHSEVGDSAVAAQINGNPAPLHAVLSNGDSVNIKKSKKHKHPSAALLHFAVTAKARNLMRDSIKKQSRFVREDMGKRLLDAALDGMNVKKKKITAEMKQDLVKRLDAESWQHLLAEIGSGKRIAAIVASQLLGQKKGASSGGNESSLAIYGTEGEAVTYATCCNPIPNQDIVGFVESKGGIIVHNAECTKIQRFSYSPERWTKMHWADSPHGVFLVPIRLETVDRKGVLARASTIIAEKQANIKDCKLVPGDSETVAIEFLIEVGNSVHLDEIKKQLKNESFVRSLT